MHWLNEQYNVPSREDHYLMAIACEVRRVLCKSPGKIQPKDFKMKFKIERKSNKPHPWAVTKKHINQMIKNRMIGIVGAKIKVVEVETEPIAENIDGK